MSEIYGTEYLLDGYATLSFPLPYFKNGVHYILQRYQGKHRNEFLLRSETGDVYLYENNVLKQKWKENKSGKKSEEFIRYKNGRVHFSQNFEYILEQMNSKRIVYHKKGLRMEIWSAQTGHLLYHGEYNERRMKEGWGIEYDEESGNMVVEGIWSKGRLIEVIRCFNGDVMTELKRNGSDSLDPVKRIPIYVGGFRYDEDNETFVREGKGCLIDEESGIAIREGEWKDGKEVSGVDLFNGKYDPVPLKQEIKCTVDMNSLNNQVTDLIISTNCCNDLKALDLNRFKYLHSIEIGNDCFENVQTFQIEGLNRLKCLKIGNNSFTLVKEKTWNDDWNDACGKANNQLKSFHILNCESLESIQIGDYSFFDFGGGFELKDLPRLQSIKVGSFNFCYSSFVIRGMNVDLGITD